MQNDLKNGKISELCGINCYIAGEKEKKIHTYFYGGGGGRIQLLALCIPFSLLPQLSYKRDT